MDATRLGELRDKANRDETRRKIAETLSAIDNDQAAEDAQFDLEGIEAMKPSRAKAIRQLVKDLGSKNERIRQTAYLQLLAYTDGKPGQRDEGDEPTEIIFRTEALPADGTIRYDVDEDDDPRGPDRESADRTAEKSALTFEL